MRINIYPWHWLCVLCLIVIGACAPAPIKSDSIKAADTEFETEITAALLAYVEAINIGDIKTAAAMYDHSVGFHWVERGGVQYEDAQAAAASLQGLVIPGTTILMTTDQHHIAPMGPGAALVSSHFDFSMQYPDNQNGFAFDGWMTIGLVKRQGKWRIAGGQVGPGSDMSANPGADSRAGSKTP